MKTSNVGMVLENELDYMNPLTKLTTNLNCTRNNDFICALEYFKMPSNFSFVP